MGAFFAMLAKGVGAAKKGMAAYDALKQSKTGGLLGMQGQGIQPPEVQQMQLSPLQAPQVAPQMTADAPPLGMTPEMFARWKASRQGTPNLGLTAGGY